MTDDHHQDGEKLTNRDHRVALDLTRAIVSSAVVVMLAAAFVLASEIVLILFLGVLFGVFLCRLTEWLTAHWPVGRGGSLAAVVTALLLAIFAATVFFFVQINHQIEQASDKIDEGVAELRQLVSQYPMVRSAVNSVPFLGDALAVDDGQSPSQNSKSRQSGPSNADNNQGTETDNQPAKKQSDDKESSQASGMDLASLPKPVQQAASTIGQLFRTTFGLVVNSLLIFFVGLFIAVAPNTYRDGIVRLVPIDGRDRAEQVLHEIGDSLWRWLIGRFGSMFVTGFGAFVLLSIIGVPMAGTLGILTGLLTFIPNIGAAVALMLAILVALPQGVSAAGMVLAAYLALQLVESYVVTPLIQQQQVSLPPALLIAFQAIMGVLFGFLGAAVASPLLAAAKTAIEMLYIEDWLGSCSCASLGSRNRRI